MASVKPKKIGPLLLSGLMVGPVLGSGIIILPPLVYSVAGEWSIFAWLLMIVTGCFFAVVFGRLSTLFPGDAGVAAAIEHAFGGGVKNLTCFYLVGAVFFGPVAVMLTAAQYLQPDITVSNFFVAVAVLFLCTFLLLRRIEIMSVIGLVMSSLSALLLFSGGVVTLLYQRKAMPALPEFSGDQFGYALLLLFWTIVGWEVVGNYSGDVEDPKKNIMKAVFSSAGVIAVVSLIVSGAVQMADPHLYTDGKIQVTAIILPIFGSHSQLLMSLVVLALCITTYLLFVGGVARLIASLADDSVLPKIFRRRNKSGAPVTAVLCLFCIHLLVLALSHLGLADVETLVALANGFFIANAFIGLATASKLIEERILKVASLVLCLLFLIIFLHSNILVISTVFSLAAVFLVRPRGALRVE